MKNNTQQQQQMQTKHIKREKNRNSKLIFTKKPINIYAIKHAFKILTKIC